MATIDRAYILRGVNEDDLLLVIKTNDPDLLKKIIDKLHKARNEKIKKIASILEGDFNDER